MKLHYALRYFQAWLNSMKVFRKINYCSHDRLHIEKHQNRNTGPPTLKLYKINIKARQKIFTENETCDYGLQRFINTQCRNPQAEAETLIIVSKIKLDPAN